MKKPLIPTLALVAANGLVYGFNALYYCFIQLYLEQFHAPVSVGILLSVGPLVAIAAPIFWGIRADRAKYKNSVLLLCVAGSAVCFFALYLGHSFWWLFCVLLVLMFFMSPFGGLIDTITLEYTSAKNIPYGPIRLSGTLIYGLTPMLLTPFTEKNLNIIFYVYVVLAAVCSLCLVAMPKVSGYGRENKKTDLRPIFGYKPLMLMFALMAVSYFSWSYYINFFPTYITGTLGMPQQVWGNCVFLTVCGEIPYFLMFNRIYDKFSLRSLMMFGMVLTTVRYFAFTLPMSAPLIYAIGLITGLSPTLITYCASVYINRHVAKEIKASAQTLLYAVSVGIPKVLAGFCGGLMTEDLGFSASMLICALLCSAALAGYAVYCGISKTKNA